MGDINEYVKELKQLKSLGLIDGEQAEELDRLIGIVESLGDTKEEETKE
jgi:orotate phosphoribosyltransferase-like protein